MASDREGKSFSRGPPIDRQDEAVGDSDAVKLVDPGRRPASLFRFGGHNCRYTESASRREANTST